MKSMILASLAIWLLLVPASARGEQAAEGKIAVATQGDTVASRVSPQAGFSPFFLLFDQRGILIETLKNPAQSGGMGSGTAAVDFLAKKDVKVIVAEGFGSRIVEYITGKGMKPVEYKGNAADAVKRVLQVTKP
jgi:predicted Fe-Mo cluster-binding NifX family protein